jgi:MFS family permease
MEEAEATIRALTNGRFLIRQPEFFKLWAGQAVSAFGSAITTVALPLTAVVVLHVSTLQMAVLAAVGVVPHLLFGLVAGVWVDRLPRRSVLVTADLGRAALLGTIPVLAVLRLLHVEYLYAIAFLAGVMALLFDTASMSVLPALVGRNSRDDLTRANSLMILSTSVAGTAGPSAAGGLVQLLTAPLAIAFDAASFLVSAGCSLLVVMPQASARRTRIHVLREIAEGMRAVFDSPVLSAVTISATVGALGGAMQAALIVLYAVRDLHLTPTLVGLAVAVSGCASILGSLLAPASTRRLGSGPAYITGQLLSAVAGLVLAAARGPLAAVALFVLVGQLLRGLGLPLFAIPQRTLRQALVPDEMLGRVNATWRFLVFGAQPAGALLGGALGTALGLRSALVGGGLVMFAAVAWAAVSPLRGLREIPEQHPASSRAS